MYVLKLPFGIKKGKLLTINEVDSGLACACICPGCQKELIAKKGKKMTHHFAHKNGMTCSTALETALHLKAKEIFKNANELMLPPVFLPKAEQPAFDAQLV